MASKPTPNLLANNRLLLVLWLVEYFGTRPFLCLQEVGKGREQERKLCLQKTARRVRRAHHEVSYLSLYSGARGAPYVFLIFVGVLRSVTVVRHDNSPFAH